MDCTYQFFSWGGDSVSVGGCHYSCWLHLIGFFFLSRGLFVCFSFGRNSRGDLFVNIFISYSR